MNGENSSICDGPAILKKAETLVRAYENRFKESGE